jgi:hypothetical protein
MQAVGFELGSRAAADRPPVNQRNSSIMTHAALRNALCKPQCHPFGVTDVAPVPGSLPEGAHQQGEAVSFPVEGVDDGSISMLWCEWVSTQERSAAANPDAQGSEATLTVALQAAVLTWG